MCVDTIRLYPRSGRPSLRRRVDQLKVERGGVTPKTKALTAEQQRIQELERQGE